MWGYRYLHARDGLEGITGGHWQGQGLLPPRGNNMSQTRGGEQAAEVGISVRLLEHASKEVG